MEYNVRNSTMYLMGMIAVMDARVSKIAIISSQEGQEGFPAT